MAANLGFAVHGVLLVLMAAALAGPYLSWLGFRLWLRLHTIGPAADEA